MKTVEVEINFDSVNEVKQRIEALTKKAIKVGVTTPTVSFSDPYDVDDSKECDEIPHFIKKCLVTYTFEPIKLGNYTFLGTIDHTVPGNAVKTVPGQSISEKFWSQKCTCDHCNTTRNRSQTFVFADGDDYKRVGRQCLKEYFGINPMNAFDINQSFVDLSEDKSFGCSTSMWYYDIEYIIAITMALVSDFGFKSNSYINADEGYVSTSSEINMVLYPSTSRESREFSSLYLTRAHEILKSGEAKALIEWAIDKFSSKSSEYEFTMFNLLNEKTVAPKYFGYIASAVGAKVRSDFSKKTTLESNHVGNVGDKIQCEVEVLRLSTSDGYYGTSYIFTMIDTLGNIFIWFASKCIFDVGDKVPIKATVKNHDEYHGKKQTVLTRVKEI